MEHPLNRPRNPKSLIGSYEASNVKAATSEGSFYMEGSQAAVLVMGAGVRWGAAAANAPAHRGVVREVLILSGSDNNNSILTLTDSANTTTANKRHIEIGCSSHNGTNTQGLVTGERHKVNFRYEDGLAAELTNGTGARLLLIVDALHNG